MQGNYVKLLYLQVRDLGKRDGRDSVWALEARKPHTDSQVRTPGLGPVRAGGHHAARGPRRLVEPRGLHGGPGPTRSRLTDAKHPEITTPLCIAPRKSLRPDVGPGCLGCLASLDP